MNPDSNDLIQRHMAGLLTDDEAAALQTRLKADTDLRKLYLHYMNLDVALEAQAGSRDRVIDLLRAAPLTENKPIGRWLSWRPLTAAAASFAFAMFCTSVVLGYVSPRAVTTVSRLFELVDGSFEDASGPVALGLPTEFGKWSGDEAEVVSGMATDGRQALRLVGARGVRKSPELAATSCDVHQLVDLRPLKEAITQGKATLELSAQFLDARNTPGEEIRSRCKIFVFSGAPEEQPDGLTDLHKEALAISSGHAVSHGGAPHSWKRITTRVLLPQEADFVLLVITVQKTKGNRKRTEPAIFGEHFADDVRLTLETEPTLPVRIVQR